MNRSAPIVTDRTVERSIGALCPPEMFWAFDEICKRKKVPRSLLLKQLIQREIDQHNRRKK